MTRLLGHFCLWALCGGIIVACATKPGSPPADSAATPSPTPATGTPAPSPTPRVVYTATAQVFDADGNPVHGSPTPAPAPTASPAPSPSPAPKPKPNVFAAAWAKIFPPKPTPTPPAPSLGAMEFRVSTDGQPPAPSAASADATPAPSPAPTPLRLRPTEGFFARMWHKVFPKKKEPPVAAPPAWIGSIRLVNPAENYALIDAPNYLSLPAGETLNAVGASSESGVLRVSADRNPPFFIADIVSGRPRAGDRVYSPKASQTPEAR